MKLTGKDLVLSIVENDLINSIICEDIRLLGLYTIGELAEKMNVGTETVKVWVSTGKIRKSSFVIGKEQLYILPDNK